MIKSAIFFPDGTIAAYGTDEKNLTDPPPAHFLLEGAIGVVIHDDDRELTAGHDDHPTFGEVIKHHEYRDGALYLKGGTEPLKAQVVEKIRMKDGVVEDKTIGGWRRRVIFEPFVDDAGEEIEDEDNEDPRALPLGRWYVIGPMNEEADLNLVPIDKPKPGDRRVWKGYQGNEIEPERGVIPDE